MMKPDVNKAECCTFNCCKNLVIPMENLTWYHCIAISRTNFGVMHNVLSLYIGSKPPSNAYCSKLTRPNSYFFIIFSVELHLFLKCLANLQRSVPRQIFPQLKPQKKWHKF